MTNQELSLVPFFVVFVIVIAWLGTGSLIQIVKCPIDFWSDRDDVKRANRLLLLGPLAIFTKRIRSRGPRL